MIMLITLGFLSEHACFIGHAAPRVGKAPTKPLNERRLNPLADVVVRQLVHLLNAVR